MLGYNNLPFIPTEGPPAATAARAYSIWTSFPEGLEIRDKRKTLSLLMMMMMSTAGMIIMVMLKMTRMDDDDDD